MIAEEEWARAVQTLRAAGEVAISCHVSPDGDAFGSMLGLGLHLESLGKKVWMSWGSEEALIPDNYFFLPGVDKIVPQDQLPDEVEVFVAIDCGDQRRLDLLTPKFLAAGTRLNIDHHVSNTNYGDINLVDHHRASSAELALELIQRMGGQITPEIATALYTGVVTDTGRFQYSNTSPATLQAAVVLREAGADHLTVAEQIFESAPFDQLRILGKVLSRARLEDGVVYSWLLMEDLDGLGLEIAEDFIDFLKVVKEADVAMILKERPEGGWRVSLRSRTEIDVSAVAQSFGGGGHTKAAGFSIRGELQDVLSRVRERLAEAAKAPVA
ncbi:MAG TPA: bifunctional oligoribonuclease/PAP phosphatase NrnA [Actinomycetota bacterium]|nr:bifunctional oligoribonuclease/PAP phosphatase NrnA [Actinomycetota bacterium]